MPRTVQGSRGFRLHPERSARWVPADGMVSTLVQGHTRRAVFKAGSTRGTALDTSKEQGGVRGAVCPQSQENKAPGHRLGAREVSVLLSPGNDRGDDTEQTQSRCLRTCLARSVSEGKESGSEKVLGLRRKFQRELHGEYWTRHREDVGELRRQRGAAFVRRRSSFPPEETDTKAQSMGVQHGQPLLAASSSPPQGTSGRGSPLCPSSLQCPPWSTADSVSVLSGML